MHSGVPGRASFPNTLATETILTDSHFFFPRRTRVPGKAALQHQSVTSADLWEVLRTGGLREPATGSGERAGWQPRAACEVGRLPLAMLLSRASLLSSWASCLMGYPSDSTNPRTVDTGSFLIPLADHPRKIHLDVADRTGLQFCLPLLCSVASSSPMRQVF